MMGRPYSAIFPATTFLVIFYIFTSLAYLGQLSDAQSIAGAYHSDLRYSSKGQQASPGLYFDPESGTFRATPPDPPLVRRIDTNPEDVQTPIDSFERRTGGIDHDVDKKDKAKSRLNNVVRRRYKNVSRGNFKTKTTNLRRSRTRPRPGPNVKNVRVVKVRANSKELHHANVIENDEETNAVQNSPGPQYKHFDDASDIILETSLNKYLKEHSEKDIVKDNHKSKPDYDYVIGTDRSSEVDNEVESEEIKKVEPNTYNPLRYDFTVSSKVKKDRPQIEIKRVKKKVILPTVLPRPAKKTTETPTSTERYQDDHNNWTPSSVGLKFKTSPKPTLKSRRLWKPSNDRNAIKQKFEKYYEELSSRNEVAQEYPSDELEKFPHFPAREENQGLKTAKGKDQPRIQRVKPQSNSEKPKRKPKRTKSSRNRDRSQKAKQSLTVKPRLAEVEDLLDTGGDYFLFSSEPSGGRKKQEDEDSLSRHSTSKKTVLPFENSRIRRPTGRKLDPLIRNTSTRKSKIEIKSAATNGDIDVTQQEEERRKVMQISDLTSSTVQGWGHRLNGNLGYPAENIPGTVSSYYHHLNTYSSTTVTTTTTTRSTTTIASPTRKPIVYVENFDKNAPKSPFANIPKNLTPRPKKNKFPLLENNPLLPPHMPGYGAPDLYGQTVPKRKIINENKKKIILPDGLTYENYFAYGKPTASTISRQQSAVNNRKSSSGSRSRSSSLPNLENVESVDIRPYGQNFYGKKEEEEENIGRLYKNENSGIDDIFLRNPASSKLLNSEKDEVRPVVSSGARSRNSFRHKNKESINGRFYPTSDEPYQASPTERSVLLRRPPSGFYDSQNEPGFRRNRPTFGPKFSVGNSPNFKGPRVPEKDESELAPLEKKMMNQQMGIDLQRVRRKQNLERKNRNKKLVENQEKLAEAEAALKRTEQDLLLLEQYEHEEQERERRLEAHREKMKQERERQHQTLLHRIKQQEKEEEEEKRLLELQRRQEYQYKYQPENRYHPVPSSSVGMRRNRPTLVSDEDMAVGKLPSLSTHFEEGFFKSQQAEERKMTSHGLRPRNQPPPRATSFFHSSFNRFPNFGGEFPSFHRMAPLALDNSKSLLRN